MAARAQHSTSEAAFGPYAAYNTEGQLAEAQAQARYVEEELWPGERIGPAPRGARGKILRRLLLLAAIGAGGAWAVLGDTAPWLEWVKAKTAVLSAAMERGASAPAKPTALSAAAAAPPFQIEPVKRPEALPPAPEPQAASKPAPAPAAPITTAALPSPAERQADPSAPADPSDPLRKRAEAVGLHPDLSRVLLERLTPADYRNAEHAIKTAVAETPDTGVLVWPKQRKPELALFQVKFVQGAAPNCRRYVVSITKDGWLTTALPMEKCGVRSAQTARTK